MKAVLELLEGFFIVLTIGVTLIMGVALFVHTFIDRPEYRPDLTVPPIALMCPDASNHCRAYQ